MQRRPRPTPAEEVVRSAAAVFGPTPEAVRTGWGGEARPAVAVVGRVEFALPLKPLAAVLGVDRGRLSKMASEGERRMETDRLPARRFREVVKSVENETARDQT